MICFGFNCNAGDRLFDASQYAFFGKDTSDKPDFGCLEVGQEEDNSLNGFGDDEYHLFNTTQVYTF